MVIHPRLAARAQAGARHDLGDALAGLLLLRAAARGARRSRSSGCARVRLRGRRRRDAWRRSCVVLVVAAGPLVPHLAARRPLAARMLLQSLRPRGARSSRGLSKRGRSKCLRRDSAAPVRDRSSRGRSNLRGPRSAPAGASGRSSRARDNSDARCARLRRAPARAFPTVVVAAVLAAAESLRGGARGAIVTIDRPRVALRTFHPG